VPSLSLDGTFFVTNSSQSISKQPTDPYKAMFIYVSPIDDFGWTTAHNKGRLRVSEDFGVALVADYVESIPEHNTALVRSIIQQEDYDLIFLTSEGYLDPMMELSLEFPSMEFVLLTDIAIYGAPSGFLS